MGVSRNLQVFDRKTMLGKNRVARIGQFMTIYDIKRGR